MTKVIIGIVLPFLGTTLGSATVFFLKKEMNSKLQNLLRGFAAGVMIAASVWSLLIPSIDMAEAAGKTAGMAARRCRLSYRHRFMLLLDSLIPHLHTNSARPEGRPSAMGKNLMLMLAVTLHNIPEGMAVGIVLAGMLNGNNAISASGAIALAVGIAIQNFPEGANNFSPPRRKRNPEGKAFACGTLSGVAEPVGAILTILVTSLVTPVLPYILAFAAGAMIYVVIEELIPESRSDEHSNVGTVGAALGFALMMLLDVALG